MNEKEMLKEMTPDLFMAGLRSMLFSDDYETVEFKITAHRKRTADIAEAKPEQPTTRQSKPCGSCGGSGYLTSIEGKRVMCPDCGPF